MINSKAMRKVKHYRRHDKIAMAMMTGISVAEMIIVVAMAVQLKNTADVKNVYAANQNTTENIITVNTGENLQTSFSMETSDDISNTTADTAAVNTDNAELSSSFTISDTDSTSETGTEAKTKKKKTSGIAAEKAETIRTETSAEPSITATGGTFAGPSGKETYYNLPMDGVISIMRKKGYAEADYPYWVRDDGTKMFGNYVMVAANLNIRPKGTILSCSRGEAIVVDTGDFAAVNPTQLDIATSWP